MARDCDKKAYSDLTYVGRKTIHINLPFTRSRETKDEESLFFFKKTEPLWLCCWHRQTLHYKRHRTKKPTEFHLPSPIIHKSLQSKMSLSNTSKFSVIISKLSTYLLYQHLFHSNAAKYRDHFLVRSTFMSENQPETFKCKTHTMQNLSLFF